MTEDLGALNDIAVLDQAKAALSDGANRWTPERVSEARRRMERDPVFAQRLAILNQRLLETSLALTDLYRSTFGWEDFGA